MKITYLFGAGASAQALPITTGIPGRIVFILNLLRNAEYHFDDSESFSDLAIKKIEVKESLISDLEWVLNNSANHASIDTFAKKLSIKSQYGTLDRLKIAFSIFLTLEQIINKVDKRYDAFYASILSAGIDSFPQNVRIISWNYDIQFEKAYAEYTEKRNVAENQRMLRILNKFTHHYVERDGFSIFKLNGTSSIINNELHEHTQLVDEFHDGLSKENFDAILHSYALLHRHSQKLSIGLSFAWEQTTSRLIDVVQSAKASTQDTSILVVVGYSFPFFNRDIDRQLVNNMIGLKKVYLQSPEADMIKDRFKSVRLDFEDSHIYTSRNVEQFLLPNEL